MNPTSIYRLANILFALVVVSAPALGASDPPVRYESLKLVPGEQGSPNDTSFQKFGAAIDMEGGRILIGAWADDTLAEDSGAAYLFNASNGQFLKKLTTTQNFSQTIGESVALYGNAALAGTPIRAGRSGTVHLFDATTGARIRQILPSGVGSTDYYGVPVAVDGTTAVVGAHADDDNGFLAGAAYLMDITNNTLIAKLKPNDARPEELFGFSADIRNGIAIVGSASPGATSGGAYLFNAVTGAQLSKLVPLDGDIGDEFGYSVAIDGHYAVVGSRFDDAFGPDSGSAYLFDITDPTSPVQLAKWIPADIYPPSGFGVSVDISGNYAIIGEQFQRASGGLDTGAAFLFNVATRSLITKLLPSDQYIAGEFGTTVAIDGSIVAVGAQNDNPNGLSPGAVYLYFVPEPSSTILLGCALAFMALSRISCLRRNFLTSKLTADCTQYKCCGGKGQSGRGAGGQLAADGYPAFLPANITTG